LVYVIVLDLPSQNNLRINTIGTKQKNKETITRASIYNTSLYRNSIICITASSFIAGTLTMPLHAQQANKGVNINLNDIAFVARIEKLVERVQRYKDKLESGKLIEVMLEIKTEVEA